jgi:hypothetical protein
MAIITVIGMPLGFLELSGFAAFMAFPWLLAHQISMRHKYGPLHR